MSTNGDTPADDDTPADTDGTLSWAQLLEETSERLAAVGIDPRAMDARRIVAEASGIDLAAMPSALDALATQRAVAHLDDMVRRRSAGEPLQYVLGSWGFRTLDLMVDRRVLIPRPETEVVVEHALVELDRCGGAAHPTTVIDIGTGSGAIALSIAAERIRSTVVATDVSADALAVASANTVGLGRAGARVQLLLGDLFDAVPDHFAGTVDLVVSNPPYVARSAELPDDVSDWEPADALWADEAGTAVLRRLIVEAPRWLTPQGALVTELSPEQAGTLGEFAREHFSEVEIGEDLAGRARSLIGRFPLSDSSAG